MIPSLTKCWNTDSKQHCWHLSVELDPPFFTLQRISVKVSQIWLLITSMGEAPVQVLPEAPLTLYFHLEFLSQSVHCAVQHASVDDDV